MGASKPAAILLGGRQNLAYVYPESLLAEIGHWVKWLVSRQQVEQYSREEQEKHLLHPETEYIFSTWGMPRLTEAFLDRAPRLKAVFYGAGSVRSFVTETSWERGIRIFSAAKANAVPVAEFTVAQIVLGMKQAHKLQQITRDSWSAGAGIREHLRGNFRSRVGLISYGSIARHVRSLLRGYELEVWVYDPLLPEEVAAQEEVRLVDLETLFKQCHVVSLHAPLLKETTNLIRGHHLASMPANGVFINTARGAIVHQQEMTSLLRERTDLTAVLDVVHPEPMPDDDPLKSLPNAFITPHIAGSMGHECGRMGMYMLEAFKQLQAGIPSPLEVTLADLDVIA